MMEVATLSEYRGWIQTALSDTRTASPAAELKHRLFWELKKVLGIPFLPENQVAPNVICVQIPQFTSSCKLTDHGVC